MRRLRRLRISQASGWVQLNAAVDPSGLHTACMLTATANVLHPYGLHPLIIYRSFDGQRSCLILPSSDAPADPQRAGEPATQTAAALIEYRQPVPAGGCISATGGPCKYSVLVIYADPAHILAIAGSARLHR
jgi:hypothetical protein